MKSLLTLLIIASLFFSNCDVKEQIQSKPEITPTSLQQLVMMAINGSKIANDSLSGLIDQNTPVNSVYNELKVDTFSVADAKKFFTVLLEYPNPAYNRFAVYDFSLRPIIIDKSLNGWLSAEPMHVDDMIFIKLLESFNSKDIIEFERLSLYKVEGDSIYLSFRIFTKFQEPKNTYTQKILRLSKDSILTQINSPKMTRKIPDVFFFNDSLKSFRSGNNLFNQFIMNEIKNFNQPVENPQLQQTN